jgi:hypothetical protein
MRQITYAGGTFLTGDAIAEALMEYAAALANADRAATVHVPAVDNGDITDVNVLIGPASQLMAEKVVHAGPEPDGTAIVDAINDRMEHLTRTYIPVDGESAIDWDI